MGTEQEVLEQEPQDLPGEVETPADEVVEVAESAPAEEPTPEVKAGAPAVEDMPEKVQKRIDEISWQKFEAQRERDYWKMQAEARLKAEEAVKAAPAPIIPSYAPRQEDFESYEQYDEALFDWRYQQRVTKERADISRQQDERMASEQQERARAWAETGKDKYPDFASVALREPWDGGPLITQFMAGAIQDSEVGHDLAYYLGHNLKEAARIAKLTPIAQVREIGRLEFKVQSPKQRETTKAPAPTAPVGGKENPSVRLEDLSYPEYKAYRERQLTGGK